MKIAFRYLAFAMLVLMTASAIATYKAGAPRYYKDVERGGFGSILKSKLLKGLSGPKDSTDKTAGDLGVTTTPGDELTRREKLWNAAFCALKGFSMEEVSKSGRVWIIRTSRSRVESFDNTGVCQYEVVVTIDEACNVEVRITSAEDSPLRLTRLQDSTRSRILEVAEVTPA
jgi:hypothetical protein